MKPNTLIDAHKSVHHDSVDFIYSTFMVYMLPLFRWFFEWLGFCYPTSESPSIVVSDVVNATQTFVEPLLQKFKNTYDSKDRGVEKYNASIEAVFYSLNLFSKIIQDESNVVESHWKSNLLFKNTPRGNVVMHYDVYKQGFAYYSDQQHIPYAILNAVAMEYVTSFRCRDFFMDEYIIPIDVPSQLVTLQQMEEKLEKEKKRESASAIDRSMLNDAPFAKFKSYKTADEGTTASVSGSGSGSSSVKEKKQNRFIYLGRMNNFSFIQKSSPKKNGFDSTLLPGNRTTSYAEYKQKLAMQQDQAVSDQAVSEQALSNESTSND
jgi:hypothetical protein